jgi:divalent metal cation (Fe/Co/Zn/Cd) transporter
MPELVQISSPSSQPRATPRPPVLRSHAVLWIQGVTLAWMLIECGASLYAAAAAHSPAMLAFGSDSVVELLSATLVLVQFSSPKMVSERNAGRIAGALLFLLALTVAATAVLSLALRLQPETSRLGMVITIAALVAMPLLATWKRREARRINNVALAADAVQSATCAYLALITLTGLAANAAFHIPWVDSMAALVAVPVLFYEGRSAWQGHACGCC